MMTEAEIMDANEAAAVPQEDTAQVEALLAEAEAESAPEGEDPAAFVPDTPDKVNWLLGKIADRRSRAARIRENADKLAKAEEAHATYLLWKYDAALQAFCRQQTEGKKQKFARFLHGVMGFRTKPASVTVLNEPDVRRWAEANMPEALRVDPRILAKHVLTNGDTLDGNVRINPAEEVFYVK